MRKLLEGKVRVVEDEKRLIYIQQLKFGFVWWTLFKTYNSNGALAFVGMLGKEYNKNTGYYE